MSKQWLSEERTRRLEELRAKYRQPEPIVIDQLTWADIKQWNWNEDVGWTLRDGDYWHVTHGEVELESGGRATIWVMDETWLPCRTEILDHCPPLDTPPQSWFDDAPALG